MLRRAWLEGKYRFSTTASLQWRSSSHKGIAGRPPPSNQSQGLDGQAPWLACLKQGDVMNIPYNSAVYSIWIWWGLGFSQSSTTIITPQLQNFHHPRETPPQLNSLYLHPPVHSKQLPVLMDQPTLCIKGNKIYHVILYPASFTWHRVCKVHLCYIVYISTYFFMKEYFTQSSLAFIS